jgi:hypothetical protein
MAISSFARLIRPCDRITVKSNFNSGASGAERVLSRQEIHLAD